MRDYAKISPQFWNGATGRALKKKGPEAVIVSLYLMTCQHANMLGLYHLNKAYIAVDTGLPFEGASKGLAGACEVGFCSYDEDSEVVWVKEMALYQVGENLEAKDNRCKGIQREYESVIENPFLTAFYERYAKPFHMTMCRGNEAGNLSPSEAPLKPLRSQEQEQEQEQDQEQKQEQKGSAPIGAAAAKAPAPASKPSPAPAPKEPKTAGKKEMTAEEQAKADVWNAAVFVLAKGGCDNQATARSFMGKLVQDYGFPTVKAAVAIAASEQPAEAREFLKATCQRLQGERGGRNGRGLSDSERSALDATTNAEAKALLFGTKGSATPTANNTPEALDAPR